MIINTYIILVASSADSQIFAGGDNAIISHSQVSGTLTASIQGFQQIFMDFLILRYIFKNVSNYTMTMLPGIAEEM